LSIYEYFITLEQEANAVWNKMANATSFLLLTLRWAMVAEAVLSIMMDSGSQVSRRVCVATCVVGSRTDIWLAFSALRIFAICDRSLPWALLVFTLGLVPLTTNLVSHSYGPCISC
ncbi:hypothetical protein PHLGIDRAFT_63188, partial [Phlebiopsis gigantea 11061_1 CR5-6]